MPAQPDENAALLYAMGALSGDARDEFERQLASGDLALLAEVEILQSAMESVAVAAPDPAPRRRVKDRLMAAALNKKFPGFEEPEPGVHVLAAGDGVWKATGYTGVSAKLLHLDKDTRIATSLLRLAPGAVYPAHHHHELEQCLVISGDIRLGSKIHIHAGDYEKALAGTDHGNLTSDTGCEVLIISSLEDEILS